MVDDRNSPVASWLRTRFPFHRGIQRQIRETSGTTKVEPPEGAVFGTVGGAIDWWLRVVVDPDEPQLDLAFSGIRLLGDHPAAGLGIELLGSYGISILNHDLEAEKPARLTESGTETQARVCYALALFTEVFRAPIAQSKLLSLQQDSSVDDLLGLASDDEVADLIAMRTESERSLLPYLPSGAVVCGPTFEGSRDLSADADLIVGDLLLELKATRGGKPRGDGKRTIRFERSDVDQLLGYLLMDYTDAYGIAQVGVYAPRFASFNSWPVEWFLAELAGRVVDLGEARDQFKSVLQEELPQYLESLRR
ncbi:hypothetical protein [Glycomyces salinus]|uniref:hypothetical protein n=1 Tax=Glycomyces salinus TaxID=980294 RepID=UPI0018ECB557|nr:hypothetical protein [Glycomyces salinus]